jgi:hypothetical protein
VVQPFLEAPLTAPRENPKMTALPQYEAALCVIYFVFFLAFFFFVAMVVLPCCVLIRRQVEF